MAKDKITLEDLLALKRTEHPSDEQWREFDERLKDRLLRQIVHKPSLVERVFARVSPIRIFAAGTASLALAAAVFAPIYIAGISNQQNAQTFVGELKTSTTPLPSVEASFAVNEIPSVSATESPVFAQMNAGEGEVRYVSNSVGGTVVGSF